MNPNAPLVNFYTLTGLTRQEVRFMLLAACDIIEYGEFVNMDKRGDAILKVPELSAFVDKVINQNQLEGLIDVRTR